jgi:hypothetical protein
VKVVWSDPLPENKVEQIQNAKEIVAMKLASKETESTHLGYDWKKESERIDAETKAAQKNLGEIIMDNLRDKNEDPE